MPNEVKIHWKHTFPPKHFVFQSKWFPSNPTKYASMHTGYVKNIMPTFLLLLIRKWCQLKVDIHIKEREIYLISFHEIQWTVQKKSSSFREQDEKLNCV